jgi:hypothetical protein
MIVVIVADQHRVDRRQVVEADSRRTMPLRSRESDRRAAHRPDRIRQHIDAIELQQERRMIDERDAQSSIADAFRRFRPRRRVDPSRPESRLAVHLPLQKRALRLPAGMDVVKPPPIEVIAARPVIPRRGEDEPLNRHRGGDCRGTRRDSDAPHRGAFHHRLTPPSRSE